jgi:hypothetical protein
MNIWKKSNFSTQLTTFNHLKLIKTNFMRLKVVSFNLFSRLAGAYAVAISEDLKPCHFRLYD